LLDKSLPCASGTEPARQAVGGPAGVGWVRESPDEPGNAQGKNGRIRPPTCDQAGGAVRSPPTSHRAYGNREKNKKKKILSPTVVTSGGERTGGAS